MTWSTGSRGFSAGNVASLDTGSLTISGSNKYLRALAYAGAGTPANLSSITLDPTGVNEALSAGDAAVTFNTNFRASTRFKIAPSDVTAKIVRAVWASNQDETMNIADLHVGIDQTTGHRTLPTPAQGSGASSGTLAVTSVAGDDVVGSVCVGSGGGGMTTMSSSQVTIREKVEGNDIGGFECCCQGNVVATGVSTTVGAQWAGNTGTYVVFGAALIPATGGAASQNVDVRRNRPGRGPYSLGRYFRPGVDAYANAAARTAAAVAADTITFSDSAVAVSTLVAAATDTIAFSDSSVALTSRVAEATDTIAFSDSAVAATSLVAAASDTISFSDSADGLVAFPAEAADTITFSDTADAITSRVAAATDTVTFSDAADAVTSRVAVASDTITFTDTAEAVTSGIIVVAADTVTFSDSAEALTSRTAEATDSVTFSDSAAALSTLVAAATDTISFSDSAVGVLGSQTFTAEASDTIVFSDSAVAERPGDTATDPKLIAKRKLPNVGFKGVGQRKKKKPTPAPAVVEAKAPSPLMLGLLARGLTLPPVLPVPPEPAPVLLDASIITPSVVAEPPPSIAEEKQEEDQHGQLLAEILSEVKALRAEVAMLRRPGADPAEIPVLRDPLNDALHAILPALRDQVDLDADPPPAPEPEPPSTPPAPAAPPRMTRAELEAENERRARVAARLLL